jgi:hypothetical protein
MRRPVHHSRTQKGISEGYTICGNHDIIYHEINRER